jgi:hypothetical protein
VMQWSLASTDGLDVLLSDLPPTLHKSFNAYIALNIYYLSVL